MSGLTKNNGFSIMAALGVASLLAATSLVIFMYSRTVEAETKNMSIKHSMQIAEDIVRTQIAIQTRVLTSRTNIIAFLNKFDPAGKTPDQIFKVPIHSTKCSNGEVCYIEVLAFNYGGTVGSSSYPTSLNLSLGVKASENSLIRLSPLTLSFSVPSSSDISARARTQSSLICPLAKPIFLGTTKSSTGQIVAQCESIKPSINDYTINITPTHTDALCLAQNAKWMSELSSKISPKCLTFPQGFDANTDVAICTAPEVAKSYELGNNFKIKNQVCLKKGGAYDFLDGSPKWGL